jgi:uncharacterized protein (TIGR03437 family)
MPFQNGQAARAVVGQFTFSNGDQNPTGQVLGGAGGIAWAGNRLFVADSNRLGATPNDDRVLVFDTTVIPGPHTDITTDSAVQTLTSCYVCGTPAIFSLGQDTFTPPTYVPSGQSTPVTGFYNGYNGGEDVAGTSPVENAWLYDATAVASDGVHFAIADTDNNRVLLWNSIPTGNTHPDLVVGQPNFNTLQTQQLGVVTATSMRGPQGVWIANGKLYVADTQDYRVLIWNSWPTTNNQPPDVVLGQPDFTHANAPPPTTTAPSAAANQLLNPVSVTADGGHVFVSDLGFNRVLIWNTTSPTMDQNADVVIGQPDFVQTTSNNVNVCYTTPGGSTALPRGNNGQCQASVNFPRFALSDGIRLFVADGGNDRVLIFNTIPTVNGTSATGILGQTNFTNDIVTSVSISIVSTEVDNTGSVDTTPSPTSLAWDGTNLYVADPYNRRVLLFSAGDTLIPSAFDTTASVIPVVNWASEIVRQEGTITFTVTVGGKITAGDTATVTIASVAYLYTEKANDTPDNIAKALVAKINASDQNVSASFGGPGTGTIYLSSLQKSGAESTSLAYDTISLAATVSNTANVTVSTSGDYLSAGNAATTSPGTLVEVNAPPGVTFTDIDTTYVAQLNSSTNSGNIPNNVNGVELYLDGFASPLYKVTPTQLVGQVPYFYGDRNSTSVYVRTVHNDGSVTVTNATPVYIAPANPGIFDAQQYPDQNRPWPISQAVHQLGNPVAVVSIDGSATVNDEVAIYVNGNSTPYEYTVQASDVVTTLTATQMLQNVVTGLVNAINNANDPYVTASAGGAFTRVVLTARAGPFASPSGSGIPISVATGTTTAGLTSCTTTTTTATETLTPYGSSGNDALCHATVNTCCAVVSGSPIFPGNPAVPGELISISGAGLGDIQNTSGSDITDSITTGFPYNGPAPPLNDVLAANFVAATLGGESAQVIFAGLTVGSYGIYRVDVLIPTGMPSNPQTPFYMAQNAFISNTVYLPVGSAVSNPPSPPVPVPPSPINMSIDTPLTPQFGSVTTVSGSLLVSGWAIDSTTPVTSVAIQIDGLTVGMATYGTSRPDVCVTYPTVYSCPNVGYTYTFDTTLVANGNHTLQILVTDANGLHRTNPQGVAIFVNNNPLVSNTHVDIDTPTTAGQIYHGTVMFSGWATNDTSPITSLTAYLDGTQVNSSQIIYGISRPDVCATAVPGTPSCPNVGWNYLADLNNLPNSTTSVGTTAPHTFSITAVAANGQQYTVSSSFYVNNYDPVDLFSGPSVDIDTPSASAGTLSGNTVIFGWAIDPYTSIVSIGVSVDGVPMENVFYGLGRPDVCAAYASVSFAIQNCPYVGYDGTLDTTLIADGQHTLGITATPASGQPYTLTRTITVANMNTSANPVRINIDSPTEGAATPTSFSGIAPVAGWALTDTGSTASIQSVEISVDGVVNGTATYGISRPDVCAVYPSRPGCPNVGFSYSLDTTRFTNGTHILEATSTTTDGKRATASASFTVTNSSTSAITNIDSPNAASIPYSGIATTSGWAIKTGVAISSVSVSIDGIPSGTATYGLPRPDVCTTYPGRPGCPNVGWTYMFDTDALLDGTHTLGVTATAADGTANTVSTAFTVQNWSSATPLNSSIDVPNPAEPYYTGQVTFYGWLSEPNVSITNVLVSIDGIPVGNAPRMSRPDACAAFSSPDCPNVGWSLQIDTSLYTNNVHTLAVTGTTADGQTVTVQTQFTTEN